MLNKNIFRLISVLSVFVLAVVVLGGWSGNADAATCTSQSSGDWHTVARWGGCGGGLPQSADDVVIASGHAITMSGSATVTSLTFNDAVAAANSVTVGSGNTLTVSGATTYTATTGAAGSTIAVGAGTFSTGTLVINDGAAAGDMVLSVSTGTINVTGHVSGTWTNAEDVQFTSTGDSDMNFGGNFPSGGTLDGTGGRITFNGTGAQDVGAYTTYNNVTINKTAGTATLLGTTTILGTLTITDGNLDTNTRTFTVTGATDITDTITFGTGTKTFTGNVTLNSGAVWNETGAAVVPFAGNLTNNATTFTASTGLHTFSGATKVISGSTATVIPSIRISGNTSNSGTITAATLLEVADGITLTNTGTVTTGDLADVGTTGTFVNSTNGTLNLSNTSTIGTLTATASGNTVNYTRAGAQTVFDPGTATDYVNLGLSGSGAKTIAANTDLTGRLTISGTATATLSGDGNSADRLTLGGSNKSSGTWGSTGSTLPAAHQDNTYFTAAATGSIAITSGGSSSVIVSGGGSSSGSSSSSDDDEDKDEDEPAVTEEDEEETTIAGCTGGNLFSTVTGQACTSTTVVAGCTATTMYSPVTGQKCPMTTGSSTGTSMYAFGTVTIKQGSTGDACKAWQMFLNAKANAGLVVDGMCGPKTMAAAKTWQASVGLMADGLLGPMSRAKASSM